MQTVFLCSFLCPVQKAPVRAATHRKRAHSIAVHLIYVQTAMSSWPSLVSVAPPASRHRGHLKSLVTMKVPMTAGCSRDLRSCNSDVSKTTTSISSSSKGSILPVTNFRRLRCTGIVLDHKFREQFVILTKYDACRRLCDRNRQKRADCTNAAVNVTVR